MKKAIKVHVSLAVSEIESESRRMSTEQREVAMNDLALSNVFPGIRHIEEIAAKPIG
jgi:hypothetical protein